MTFSGIIFEELKVFGNVVKQCLECLIDLLSQNKQIKIVKIGLLTSDVQTPTWS